VAGKGPHFGNKEKALRWRREKKITEQRVGGIKRKKGGEKIDVFLEKWHTKKEKSNFKGKRPHDLKSRTR